MQLEIATTPASLTIVFDHIKRMCFANVSKNRFKREIVQSYRLHFKKEKTYKAFLKVAIKKQSMRGFSIIFLFLFFFFQNREGRLYFA